MQKDFIQPRRIEAFGHVPGGAVHEVPLQIENGVYVAADFPPGQLGLHTPEHVFPLVPALVGQPAEKPGVDLVDAAQIDFSRAQTKGEACAKARQNDAQ